MTKQVNYWSKICLIKLSVDTTPQPRVVPQLPEEYFEMSVKDENNTD